MRLPTGDDRNHDAQVVDDMTMNSEAMIAHRSPCCAACGFEFEIGDGIGTRLCFSCERDERERLRGEIGEDTDETFAYLDDLEWNVERDNDKQEKRT